MSSPQDRTTDPVIIEVALNGATPKTVNPTVPHSPAEISAQALECIEAGATVVHSHPRSVERGASLQEYVDAWGPVVATHPDALLYPTARPAGPGESAADAWSHNLELKQLGLGAMSLIDPGSLSIGMRPDGHVPEAALDRVYVNSHRDTRDRLRDSTAHGLWPSISIFDPSFLRAVLGFAEAGLVPREVMIKLYFGQEQAYGLRPTPTAVDAYLELLEGTGFVWSAAVLGGDVMADGFAQHVLARGGHLRVGLEDLTQPGRRTNLELVREAVEVVEESGRQVADQATTRQILGGALT